MQEGEVFLDGARWLTVKVTEFTSISWAHEPSTDLEHVIYSSQQPREVAVSVIPGVQMRIPWLREVAQCQTASKLQS